MLFEKKTNLLFLLRELVCVFIARNQWKKKKFFLLHELVNSLMAGNQKKKIIFTARTRVFLLRELNQKKKIFFSLQLVGSLAYRQQEKKMFFLLHELDQKLVRKYYHIYVREKNWHFVLCEKKKIHFTARIQWNCVVFILRELDFFFQNAWTVSKACQIHIQHINYRHQKKETFFLIARTEPKKEKKSSYCTNSWVVS
jgi:hypothetical protein